MIKLEAKTKIMKNTLLLFAAFALLSTTGCNQSNSADESSTTNTNSAAQNALESASNAWQDTKSAATNAWSATKQGAANAWNTTTNAVEGNSTN